MPWLDNHLLPYHPSPHQKKFISENIAVLLICANIDLDFKIFCESTEVLTFSDVDILIILSWLPGTEAALLCNIINRQHLLFSGCWSLFAFSSSGLQSWRAPPFLSSCSLPTQSFLLCPQPSWSCCVYTSWLGKTCLAFPKSLSDNRSASSLRGAPSDSIHQTCFLGNFTPFAISSTGESVGRGSEEAQGGRKEQRKEWSRRRAGGRAHSL